MKQSASTPDGVRSAYRSPCSQRRYVRILIVVSVWIIDSAPKTAVAQWDLGRFVFPSLHRMDVVTPQTGKRHFITFPRASTCHCTWRSRGTAGSNQCSWNKSGAGIVGCELRRVPTNHMSRRLQKRTCSVHVQKGACGMRRHEERAPLFAA